MVELPLFVWLWLGGCCSSDLMHGEVMTHGEDREAEDGKRKVSPLPPPHSPLLNADILVTEELAVLPQSEEKEF
jgi:hypothetical protein